MEKRYWANVSEVFFHSEDAALKLPRRAKREVGRSLARRPRMEFLLESSHDNDGRVGAFGGSFAVKSDRNAAFSMVIYAR